VNFLIELGLGLDLGLDLGLGFKNTYGKAIVPSPSYLHLNFNYFDEFSISFFIKTLSV